MFCASIIELYPYVPLQAFIEQPNTRAEGSMSNEKVTIMCICITMSTYATTKLLVATDVASEMKQNLLGH